MYTFTHKLLTANYLRKQEIPKLPPRSSRKVALFFVSGCRWKRKDDGLKEEKSETIWQCD